MTYEHFQRCKDNIYAHHFTLDNFLSCLAITVYVGSVSYLIYHYVTS